MPKRSAAEIQPERIPDRRVYAAMPKRILPRNVDYHANTLMPKRSAGEIQPERIPERRVYAAMPKRILPRNVD